MILSTTHYSFRLSSIDMSGDQLSAVSLYAANLFSVNLSAAYRGPVLIFLLLLLPSYQEIEIFTKVNGPYWYTMDNSKWNSPNLISVG